MSRTLTAMSCPMSSTSSRPCSTPGSSSGRGRRRTTSVSGSVAIDHVSRSAPRRRRAHGRRRGEGDGPLARARIGSPGETVQQNRVSPSPCRQRAGPDRGTGDDERTSGTVSSCGDQSPGPAASRTGPHRSGPGSSVRADQAERGRAKTITRRCGDGSGRARPEA